RCILIIDALDECENEYHIRTILQLLVEARSLRTVRLRVFLTSRPEIPVRHGICAISQAEHQDFRRILGSIVNLFSPLPVASLAKVISISGTQVTRTLERLQAILDVPKDVASLLRLHHPSFRDFLLNKDRLNEKEAHQRLATSCIQLMSQALKKDICGIHAPSSQVSQVESGRLQEYLSHEVQYACLYWVQHL
ncbi:hypothetical protein BKA65DRAFT_413863, partial [Rhexocercosporidium sp. MPI-PUGE-AT-0058]